MSFSYTKYQSGDEKKFSFKLYSDPRFSLGEKPFGDSTLVVIDNGKIVCFFDISLLCNITNYYIIDMFEVVIEHNIGIGSKIVSDIKSCDNIKKIEVNPVNNSQGFWEKQGFLQVSEDTWLWEK